MEIDLRDYIKVIRKRLWIIIAIVLISCLTSGIFSFFLIDPVYEASTKLIVNKSNQRVGLDQVDINSINTNLRLIDTYKEIIKTPAIMDNVVSKYPEFNLTTEQLISQVKVSSVNNTQVMTLIVQDKSYAKAAKIVNAVSKVFEQEIPKIMKVDNVSLLNEAKIIDNPAPVKPNKKLNVAISFIVSMMVAVGLVFLLEYLDDTIKNESDIQQYLGIPALGLISKIRPEDIELRSKVEESVIGSEKNHVTVNQ
jgi:capsular polysaccharide biosynthesis protein